MATYHCEIKRGQKGSAVDHANYIARQGWHSKRGDLLFTGFGNLPSWAENQPARFWGAADRYERSNGVAYRELVIAHPAACSMSQLRELTLAYVKAIVGDKPFQYAVHAPPSSLEGECNPHLHLMFSERLPDEFPRSAAQTFARYNRTDPSRGGCKKDNAGRTRAQVREALVATRKKVADIQNEHLERFGHPSRVDHRTLQEQRLGRQPERHLGPARIKRMSPTEKAAFIALRPKVEDRTNRSLRCSNPAC